MSIRVCHVIEGERLRGATQGALNLHGGLRTRCIVDSSVLSTSSLGLDPGAGRVVRRNWIPTRADALVRDFTRSGMRGTFSIGAFGRSLAEMNLEQQFDVVHVHWACRQINPFRVFAKCNVPTVWTMRDYWPLTGGCHTPLGCEQFKTTCHKCPQLNAWASTMVRLTHRSKHNAARPDVVIAPSMQMKRVVEESSFQPAGKLVTIPNAVDESRFVAVDRLEARIALGLPHKGKLVLLGAIDLGERHKGLAEFKAALSHCVGEFSIITFGYCSHDVLGDIGRPVHRMGYLNDARQLSMAYSAADVFAFPSLEESFGKTMVESLMCGTPVVAFPVGAAEEALKHGLSGQVVAAADTAAFGAALDAILWAPADRGAIRNSAIALFGTSVVAADHERLYTKLVREARENSQ
ncbi:glycosyltransferase [bacterium]|nr:glycosyltransferase [bacterium]